MGQLTKSHLVESAVWALIALVFFGYSFEFNQPIEIYKFGATGWPRVILILLLLVTAAQSLSSLQARIGRAEGPRRHCIGDSSTDYSDPGTLAKVVAVLFTPFTLPIC